MWERQWACEVRGSINFSHPVCPRFLPSSTLIWFQYFFVEVLARSAGCETIMRAMCRQEVWGAQMIGLRLIPIGWLNRGCFRQMSGARHSYSILFRVERNPFHGNRRGEKYRDIGSAGALTLAQFIVSIHRPSYLVLYHCSS